MSEKEIELLEKYSSSTVSKRIVLRTQNRTMRKAFDTIDYAERKILADVNNQIIEMNKTIEKIKAL